MKKIRIKRAYVKADESDGTRILVDRLWPRGLTKEKARIDVWLKEISPSTELRKWFAHDPDKWAEFQTRYAKELEANSATIEQLRDLSKGHTVTLVYAAKDELHNEAVILQRWFGKP